MTRLRTAWLLLIASGVVGGQQQAWDRLLGQADSLRAAGRYAEAERVLTTVLAAAGGPQGAGLAAALNNLGAVYHAQARYAEAEPLYHRALAVMERELGPASRPAVACLNNLAAAQLGMARYAEAEQSCRRALTMAGTVPGSDL